MKNLLSRKILKQNIKNNWKLWLILTGILCFFIVIIPIVLNAQFDTLSKEHDAQEALKAGLIPGYVPTPFSLAGIILTLFVRMFFEVMAMGYLLMLIYTVATGNKLVASEVDRGTMSFTLNTPTTRKQIIFSKALFFLGSITAMIVLMATSATIITAILGINIDYGSLWLVALGFWLFSFALSSIAFAASCWFNKGGYSMLVGIGIPVMFFLFSTLAMIDDFFKFLKYFSMHTLYDTANIMAQTNFIPQFIALFVIGAVLYGIGINKFLKKDLPL